jgi:hypothetical protein
MPKRKGAALAQVHDAPTVEGYRYVTTAQHPLGDDSLMHLKAHVLADMGHGAPAVEIVDRATGDRFFPVTIDGKARWVVSASKP